MSVPRFMAWIWLAAAIAGCHDPITEVVVVYQSDLEFGSEVGSMLVAVNAGSTAPIPNSAQSATASGLLPGPFPISIGFTSGGMTDTFSMTAQLLRASNLGSTIVVSRTVTNIRFVDEQTKMFVLPLHRSCACVGTSCPGPGNPDCDNIDTPALQPFDSEVAPPSTMMQFPGLRVSGTPPPVRHEDEVTSSP